MMIPDDDPQIEQLLHVTDRIFGAMLPTVPREVLELDITMPQLKIMLMLYIDGPARMSSLAADLGVTLATATGLMDRLVERGLVTRENSPEDRRVVICRLSSSGQQTISRIWYGARNNMRNILRALDREKLKALSEILEDMLANAGRIVAEQSSASEKQAGRL